MRTLTIAVFAIVAIALVGCPREQAIRVDGLTRTCVLHVPASLPDDPVPLVLVLHPFLGTGRLMEAMTGLNAVADREQFIVAYPNGVWRRWNALTPSRGVDDVAFLDALLDKVAAEHAVDTSRVYVVGGSNGGMMAQLYACSRPDRVAAVATVFGTMSIATRDACPSGASVPALLIHGTEDPILPYEGGDVGYGGPILSVPENVQFWLDRNGCSGEPVTTALPDAAPNDGTMAEKSLYDTCSDAAEVAVYTITGGGHTWPGSSATLPEWIVGRTSRDFSAADAVWNFFARHANENNTSLRGGLYSGRRSNPGDMEG